MNNFDLLSFDIALNVQLEGTEKVQLTIFHDSSWQILQTWNQNTFVNPNGENFTIDLSSYLGDTIIIGFFANNTGLITYGKRFEIDNLLFTPPCAQLSIYYPDIDGDGYGDNNNSGTLYCPGNEPSDWVNNNEDCDDNNPVSYTHLTLPTTPYV